MSMTDPIADFLTRVRNAIMARHDAVEVPNSRLKAQLARILKEEGLINEVTALDDRVQGVLRLELKWVSPRENAIRSLRRESKPGRRVYVGADEIPRVRNGHGIAIVSTSRGVLAGSEAKRLGVGGELLCTIY
jgi:small subunit ribosomal protein S8